VSKSSDHRLSLAAALSKITALHNGAEGVAEIVAVGVPAVPALRDMLFRREPSGLHQVRCRVAEALGLLGAVDVLEEFLRRPRRGDAVERLGDDVVVSAAARAIARRKDNKTFKLLCELARTHPLNGLISALASFRQPSTIPILIRALDEDEVRQTAQAALASFGPDARPFLLDAIDRFKFTNAPSESQLRKCRSLLLLVGEARLNSDDIERVRSFTANPDPQVSLLACRIALCSESERARSEAREQLGYLRERVPWLERLQIDQYLASAND
jgi:HEAT repeat protein